MSVEDLVQRVIWGKAFVDNAQKFGCLQNEDRRPKTEDRRPKTEDRRPKTEDRRSKTEDRKTKSSLILGLSNSRQL